jgi:hypothetical protein
MADADKVATDSAAEAFCKAVCILAPGERFDDLPPEHKEAAIKDGRAFIDALNSFGYTISQLEDFG